MAVVEGCPDVNIIELSDSDLLTHLHIQPQEEFAAHGELIPLFFFFCFSVDVYGPSF
jgi:hypothetical protein